MVPRVVSAEVHFSVLYEIPEGSKPRPQHESENPEEDRNMIPSPEDIEDRLV